MASPDILAPDSEASFLGDCARENFRDASVWCQIQLTMY